MPPKTAAPRIVVLKTNPFLGSLISGTIKLVWPNAEIQVFQRGFDALDAIQARMPDMFITGVSVDDMDGLEHLEPFIERDLPILVVTARRDARTFSLLRTMRFDGLFHEGDNQQDFAAAIQCILDGRQYVSPSMIPHLKPPKNITLQSLTEKEQMVLSVIGDGSDDHQAAKRLKLSPHTVNTHRKAIMSKLALHHKGELMLYALQQGYVIVAPGKVTQPGFQRRIRELAGTGAEGE